MSEIPLSKNATMAEADFDRAANLPTLTIGLTDSGTPSGCWEVHIWATMPDGEMYCGGIVASGSPILGKSRIIGFACIPGAESFRVRVRRTNLTPADATARVQITRHNQNIFPPGLYPNFPMGSVL